MIKSAAISDQETLKNKGGRPRLDKDSDTVGLNIRITLDLREEFQNRCVDQGLKSSEVVRELIKAWLDKAG